MGTASNMAMMILAAARQSVASMRWMMRVVTGMSE